MIEQGLTPAGDNWREQVEHYGALLEQARHELIEAEAELAEQLAAINAFEFKLRAGVGQLVDRLEALEADIKQYRQQLLWLGDDCGDMDSPGARWSMRDVEDVYDQGAAAGGDYRYMATPAAPPQPLDAEQRRTLKQLFRQLAHRFHPDIALNEEDRAYRTGLMMAINAAYAAGDLAKLKELALEPDAANHLDYAQTDQQLAEALVRELGRCRRRLDEIKRELEKLERHKSTSLLRRAQRAEAQGRDWLAEIMRELKEKIAQKMVERDILKQEVESMGDEAPGFHGDDFADVVWDVSLDQAYDEDPMAGMADWVHKRRDRYEWDEDNLDDGE